MKLSEFASTNAAANQFVKAAFAGFAGGGKTYTASLFTVGCYQTMKIKKPLLMLDNEQGGRFIADRFKSAGIETYYKNTIEVADVLRAMEMLRSGEIGFLFVDSLTKIWYKYVRDYKEKNRRKFMELSDWGKILPEWAETFATPFVAAQGNVVFTGRGGYEYSKEEDEQRADGSTKKGQFVKSGLKMKLAGETPHEPDLVVWMEGEQEMQPNGTLKIFNTAQVTKSRYAPLHGAVITNPTYENFRPFVEFLCGLETGEVRGATDTTNLAPGEDYGAANRKRQRDIEVEKIKACFDGAGFGAGKEDKQLKVLIQRHFLGTTSATELDRMDVGVLAESRERLEQYFIAYHLEKPRFESVDEAIRWTEEYAKEASRKAEVAEELFGK